MAAIRLLLDEDVRTSIAEILRSRNFDVVHVLEAGRGGYSDIEQLAYAVMQKRVMLTHNIRDYVALDRIYQDQGRIHYGIIVSDQLPLRVLLQRISRCLSSLCMEDVKQKVVWLSDFR